ncbi:hypothetical protein fugu_013575 [Takifugu bimaculatus]|uniref:Uncharacterized protein n=1 Tax=Takifugu bimaculatus TaxID=433685 RepID=A0A4Z2C3L5_9TELE|nr:hypothetical protein fugu_013575 [Takifugu bimaculatus]
MTAPTSQRPHQGPTNQEALSHSCQRPVVLGPMHGIRLTHLPCLWQLVSFTERMVDVLQAHPCRQGSKGLCGPVTCSPHTSAKEIIQLAQLLVLDLRANVRAKVPLLDPSTMLLRRCGSLGVEAQKLAFKFTTEKMVTPAPVRLKLPCTTLASSCLRSMKALWSLQLHLLASLMLVQSTLSTLLLTLNTLSSLQRCLHIQEATPSLRPNPSEWDNSMAGDG